MARIGIFCLPMRSHMNLFLTLGQALAANGHELTFFGLPGNAERILNAGFSFERLEPSEEPSGTLDRMVSEMASLGKVAAMLLQGRFDELRYEAILRQGPALIERTNMDLLIVDGAEACSGSVAEVTGRPWVSVSSGLALNWEDAVPPFFTTWNYSTSSWAIARNRLAYAGLTVAMQKTNRLINRHRKSWGLPLLKSFNDTLSPYAQIAQQIAELDFPRTSLPSCFHYVGPLASKSSQKVDFPWDRLDGRPLIYASLGTVMTGHKRLHHLILNACRGLQAQLVLSLGGEEPGPTYETAQEQAIVVSYAPQRELLSRAALVITHAGLNSTLEALSAGTPLVAIPITFEQPGIAARIRWVGAGELISASAVAEDPLQKLVKLVLTQDSYRSAARRMAALLAQAGGVNAAVIIIEQVLRTGRKVTREGWPAARARAATHVN
jgi:zeaxanthin glucosyltransferase